MKPIAFSNILNPNLNVTRGGGGKTFLKLLIFTMLLFCLSGPLYASMERAKREENISQP